MDEIIIDEQTKITNLKILYDDVLYGRINITAGNITHTYNFKYDTSVKEMVSCAHPIEIRELKGKSFCKILLQKLSEIKLNEKTL